MLLANGADWKAEMNWAFDDCDGMGRISFHSARE